MLDDLPNDCTPWMADVLAGSSDADYNDKLSWFQDNDETNASSARSRRALLTTVDLAVYCV